MTGPRQDGRFFVLDLENDELLILPTLVGEQGDTRVVLRHQGSPQTEVSHDVPPGGHRRLALASVWPLSSSSVKLQVRREDGAWLDHGTFTSLRCLGELDRDEITPGDWGVTSRCIAVLREPGTRRVVLRRAVPGGGSTPFTYPADADSELLLEFNEAIDEGVGLGPRVGPTLRWSPVALRGSPPAEVSDHDGGLCSSRRHCVTLAPRILARTGRPLLVTEGYIGAWDGADPVVEAMDFVLGRQEMLYQPSVAEAQARPGTVIYLGRPHSSWGHFLTQGLARVWYAVQHPETPVVWDNPAPLRPYQQTVLDLLGMRNEQLLLTEPTRWDTVIFPFPGVCIGDYVLPGYVRSVGVVPPAAPVPGKRLFLTRTGTEDFPGGPEREVDDLVERHGFTVFHPQRHPIEEQLAEISSAETVVAFEGSSLHTPLLLRDPVQTRFWALTRHRRGGGLFEHIRRAKGLRYETLNFLRSPTRRAREAIDLDLDGLDRALGDTDGFSRDLHLLDDHLEEPWSAQTSFGTHLNLTQVRSGQRDTELSEMRLAVLSGDYDRARRLVRR